MNENTTLTNISDIPEGDYILTEGGAWFAVNGFAVRILATEDGGVNVNVYANGREDEDALASCQASSEQLDE